uniref:Uncharacterized protein n=1 Tax=Anguilla anguilla TaxID=7936 RepID=A0A0E9TAJ7_ANGAN
MMKLFNDHTGKYRMQNHLPSFSLPTGHFLIQQNEGG